MNNFSDYQLLNAYYKHLTTYLRANLEILKEDNLLKIAAPADPQPVPPATPIKTGLISLPKRQKKNDGSRTFPNRKTAPIPAIYKTLRMNFPGLHHQAMPDHSIVILMYYFIYNHPIYNYLHPHHCIFIILYNKDPKRV